MAAILNWIPLLLRRRQRDARLREAAAWPIITASLLKSTVEEKDPLVEGGTAFQDRQVESAFYFTLEGSYYGGHLRSGPLSDGEAHRALRQLPEDTPVKIRYNPANPDQTIALPDDNPSFPIAIWPS
jgi:hypothetical protein